MSKHSRRSFLKATIVGAAAVPLLGRNTRAEIPKGREESGPVSTEGYHSRNINRLSSSQELGPHLTPTRTIRFTTEEGTYLSLSLSPDGQMIVFDLLCQIYVLPITGGKATRLTSGLFCHTQPQFSPDGNTIAFVADNDGWSNLWLMDADGANPRQLTKEENRVFISPVWTYDGKGLLASADADGDRRGYGTSIVYYPIKGGPPQTIVRSPGASAQLLGPSVGNEGRFIYFAQRHSGGNFQVHQYNVQKGAVEIVTDEPVGAFRPIASPDGHYIVYGTRRDGNTWLKLMDLHTRERQWLIGGVQHDEQVPFCQYQDVIPGSVFTPDSRR